MNAPHPAEGPGQELDQGRRIKPVSKLTGRFVILSLIEITGGAILSTSNAISGDSDEEDIDPVHPGHFQLRPGHF